MALPLTEAEAWFVGHGLPYFVDGIRDDVRAHLGRARLFVVAAIALAVGTTAGIGVGLWSGHASFGISIGATAVLAILALYAVRALKTWMMVTWALRRTFRSLGLLFPLATRALPLLLLFITFLFINAEVWQVASSLDGGVLWLTVLLFAGVAIGFLLVRLDEELDAFDDSIVSADLLAASKGTPLEAPAQRLIDDDIDLPEEAQVTGLQMVNLVLVLVIAQAVQVLLLAVAVFGFFLVFGTVAIDDTVIESWTGDDVHHVFGLELLSQELLQVSFFLAAFSGLYFTVYAITDELYRREFFTTIMNELRRAVGARVVYRALRRTEPAA